MKKNKILIVDDSEEILFAISEFFLIKNWEVVTAQNVEKALNIISNDNTIDIIIMDYHLPYINGVTAVKLIRKFNKNIPIIALTIEGEEEVANSFFDAGANDFVIKPVKLLDLFSRINVHLKNINSTTFSNIKEHLSIHEKGINSHTIKLIREKMLLLNKYATIEEIAEATNLSNKTINRYMNSLTQTGEVLVETIYLKIGRPKYTYFWKDKE